MRKIVIFLLLIGFSFSAFAMKEAPATTSKGMSKVEKAAKLIAKLLWKSRIPAGAALGAAVGGYTGLGIFEGAGWGAGLGLGSKVFGARRGTAAYLSYRYLSEPLSYFIWRYLYSVTPTDAWVYDSSGILTRLWSYSFSYNFTLMPTIYGTLLSSMTGILAFYAVISAISYFTTKKLDPLNIGNIEKDAKKIIKQYLTTSNWNPSLAWESLKKYIPKIKFYHISLYNPASQTKLKQQFGQLILLQFIPILACALYKDEALDIQQNIPLAKDIIKFITQGVESTSNQSREGIQQKDAWLKSRYAMLYQVCHLNPASPTVAQQALLSGDIELVDLLFKDLPINIKKETLLINQDKRGRTLMHHVAANPNVNPNLFNDYLNSLFLKKGQVYDELQQAAKKPIESEKINFLKSLFELSTRKFASGKKYLASYMIDYQLQNPLHKAAFNFNTIFIDAFFTDPELLAMAMFQKDTAGRTPLHLAVMMATENNAPGEVFGGPKELKYTPLSRQSAVMTIKKLTQRLAQQTTLQLLATQDSKNKTPLHYAAEAKNSEVIATVLQQIDNQQPGGNLVTRNVRNALGINFKLSHVLKTRDRYGNTPVHAAVQPFARYLREYTIESIDSKIGKIKKDYLKIKRTQDVKANMELIIPYVQAISTKLRPSKKPDSMLTSMLKQVPYLQKTPKSEQTNYNLKKFFNKHLQTGAIPNNLPEGDYSDIDLSSEQITALKQAADILYYELNFLRQIVDLEDIKIKLQQHKTEKYFRFENVSEISDPNIILKTIKELFGEALAGAGTSASPSIPHTPATTILPQERFEILKIQNDYGQTALHMAITQDNPQIIEALIYGLTPNQKLELFSIPDRMGKTPLHLALSSRASADSSAALIQNLFNSETGILKDLTPEQRVKLLSVRDGQGQTIIYIAIKNGYPYNAVINLLMSNLTSEQVASNFLTTKDKSGRTVLHELAMSGNISQMKLLLSTLTPERKLAALKDRDISGQTMLHLAAQAGNTELVDFLMGYIPAEQKAEYLLAADKDGNTALHIATKVMNVEMIEHLIQTCPPEIKTQLLEAKNKDGNNFLLSAFLIDVPIDAPQETMARFVGNVFDVMFKTSLDIVTLTNMLTAFNKAGLCAMHYIALKNAVDVCGIISNGLDAELLLSWIALPDRLGQNVLHKAASSGAYDFIFFVFNDVWNKTKEKNIIWIDPILTTKDALGQTPLHTAAANIPYDKNLSSEEVVKRTGEKQKLETELAKLKQEQALTHQVYMQAVMDLDEGKIDQKAFVAARYNDLTMRKKIEGQEEKINKIPDYPTLMTDYDNKRYSYRSCAQELTKLFFNAATEFAKTQTLKATQTLESAADARLTDYLLERDNAGNTAFHLAVGRHDSLLVAMYAKFNSQILTAQNKFGNTIFHVAVETGDVELVSTLLNQVPVAKRMTVIRIQNADGNTPLHVAVLKNNVGLVKAITDVVVGNDLKILCDIRNKGRLGMRGKTVLDLARGMVKSFLISKLPAPADEDTITHPSLV